MSLAPQKSLPQRLYEAMLQDIGRGDYAIGSKLPVEPMLCEQYGVSRTVLREAVSRLKADGILDSQQGRGTYVLAHSAVPTFRFQQTQDDALQSLMELAELRVGVEGTAAALAATRRQPEHLKRLKSCLQRMQKSLKDGTSGTSADVEFHLTIADATGNQQYRMFMDYLQKSFASAIDVARSNSARSSAHPKIAQMEHQAIYDAIAASDPKAAEQAIKNHIHAAMKRLQEQAASA